MECFIKFTRHAAGTVLDLELGSVGLVGAGLITVVPVVQH